MHFRPNLTLELGADLWDPGLPRTNYRAMVGLEIPLFHFRGPNISRAESLATAARARAVTEDARLQADLKSAYVTFVAAGARVKALESGVVPASEKAASATEESYVLGRAALVAVLDAERALNEARIALLEARAATSNAWIEVEHLVGVQ